jgi:RimJ/RimL family protein N-acetyltransferase
MTTQYLFQSERLGFRNWISSDLSALAAMNADPAVMEHFPTTLNINENKAFLERLQNHYEKNSYTYFATEILTTGEFIGFIGLAYQDYKTPFTPATDIGWRLKKAAWGKGYATEGAKKCLEFAFLELGIHKIVSTCTINNNKSEKVMQKIGMTKMGLFKHPKLGDYPDLEECVWYEIKKSIEIAM